MALDEIKKEAELRKIEIEMSEENIQFLALRIE